MTFENQQNRVQNPAVKFIKFKNGAFHYWDKEEQKEVPVPLPFRFLAIQELATITGYDEKNNCGIYSNELPMRTMHKGFFMVRSFKGGEIATGMYREIKDRIKAAGGRFTFSVYALYGGELVNIQLKGAAGSAWVAREDGIAYVIAKTKKGKKGGIDFLSPVIERDGYTDDEYARLGQVYSEKLKPYLDDYFAKKEKEVRDWMSAPLNQKADADFVSKAFETGKDQGDDLPF